MCAAPSTSASVSGGMVSIALTRLAAIASLISARGTSGTIESYLRFTLPAAPAGTELTGATLRLTTSTDTTAASTDAHTLSLMTGSWSEQSTTWNTRPTTGFGAEVDAQTGDGGIRNDLDIVRSDDGERRDREENRRSLRGRLGSGGKQIRVRTGDGTIRLRSS